MDRTEFIHRLERRLRTRVVHSSGRRVTLEKGERHDLTHTGRVAVIAQYSPSHVMTRSLHEYIAQLDRAGYRCVVCSTCPDPRALRWPEPLPERTLVLRRRNIGYDFGSWALTLRTFPEIRMLDDVILTNDSLIGPFAPITPLLEAYQRSGVEVWSLTDSYEFAHHLQSYFLGFRGQALGFLPLKRFFDSVRVERTVLDVVMTYEIGLSALLRRSGLTHASHFRSEPDEPEPSNPTIVRWEPLLDQGFPFLKRTLVKGQDRAAIESGPLTRAIRERFGTELADWL